MRREHPGFTEDMRRARSRAHQRTPAGLSPDVLFFSRGFVWSRLYARRSSRSSQCISRRSGGLSRRPTLCHASSRGAPPRFRTQRGRGSPPGSASETIALLLKTYCGLGSWSFEESARIRGPGACGRHVGHACRSYHRIQQDLRFIESLATIRSGGTSCSTGSLVRLLRCSTSTFTCS